MDEKYNNIDPIYNSNDASIDIDLSSSDDKLTNEQESQSINNYRTYTPVDKYKNNIIEPDYKEVLKEPTLSGDSYSTYKSEETQHTENYNRSAETDQTQEEKYYGNSYQEPPTPQEPLQSQPDHRRKKPSRGFKFFRFVAVFIVFVFLGGIVFGAGYGTAIYLGSELTPELVNTNDNMTLDINKIENVVSATTNEAASGSVVTIAETAGPSVVTVTSTIQVEYNSFFGNQSQETEGTGSGIIYKTEDDQLLIITNHHVIEGASHVEVTLNNGISLTASIVGYDSLNDLAVLSIPLESLNEAGVSDITVATFGDSEALKVGELAVAIGNPLGKEFSSTVTAGVISAVNRELNIDGTNLVLLQTDAAINPGNSGGALVNITGEVVGINTAKYVDESVEGMGFSIPVHIALPIIESIVETGSGSDIAYEISGDKPFLGVQISDIDDSLYNETGMPFGVYIQTVYDGSAAETAGLQSGDVIYSIDGTRVMNSDELFEVLATHSVGDTLEISVSRGDENLHLNATLTKYSDVVTD